MLSRQGCSCSCPRRTQTSELPSMRLTARLRQLLRAGMPGCQRCLQASVLC